MEPAAGSRGSSSDATREALMEAVLTVSGDLGYRKTTVQRVAELAGRNRMQFWEHFANKEECFVAAHAVWMDRLVADLLAAALVESRWRDRVRASLAELLRFASARPALASALLVEAEVVGGRAFAQRDAAVEQLGAALDSGRDALPADRQPPPLTGVFLVGGVVSFLADRLAASEAGGLLAELPQLYRFVTDPYWDDPEEER